MRLSNSDLAEWLRISKVSIDKNIPVPSRHKKSSWCAEIGNKLKAGDSICFGDINHGNITKAKSLQHWFHRNGMRATVSSQKILGEVRLWRVK